jgi:hypothetical protein
MCPTSIKTNRTEYFGFQKKHLECIKHGDMVRVAVTGEVPLLEGQPRIRGYVLANSQ